jgi:hypothetical protein
MGVRLTASQFIHSSAVNYRAEQRRRALNPDKQVNEPVDEWFALGSPKRSLTAETAPKTWTL